MLNIFCMLKFIKGNRKETLTLSLEPGRSPGVSLQGQREIRLI